MKRKKDLKVDASPQKDSLKTSKAQRASRDMSDVADIKKKISKVNLYLSLVNKGLFVTVGIDEVATAEEIESEVNEFLISKAKAVFATNEGMAGLSSSEWAFLKLLSKKGTQVQTTDETEPVQAVTPEWSKPTQLPAVVAPIQEVTKRKSNSVKKVVSIIGEDGNPKEVDVETEKIVIPPPTVKRHLPPSFEQQMQRASQDMAAMQRAVQSTSGPLMVDSSEE